MNTLIKDMEIIEQLIRKRYYVCDQIKEWKLLTGKSRNSYFRIKKKLFELKPELKLLQGTKPKSFKFNGYDSKVCYFCGKKAKIIHHINQNREDNRKENLLPLCSSCHNKLHRIYKSLEEN